MGYGGQAENLLSIKGIIDIERSTEGAGDELQIDISRAPTCGGCALERRGMHDKDDAVGSKAARLHGAGPGEELTATRRAMSMIGRDGVVRLKEVSSHSEFLDPEELMVVVQEVNRS
jgi:hypothetical protein